MLGNENDRIILRSSNAQILKYKKGRLADRTQELNKLRDYIIDILPRLEPALSLSTLDNIPAIAAKQTGKELKAIEESIG